MTTHTNSDERFLKGSAVALTALLVVLLALALQRATSKPHFAELSVERVNIVEPNGIPRLIIHNAGRTPQMILQGKEQPHPNRTPSAGMHYFNDEGTENGGALTFDMFDQDQVVSLVGGLRVWDQPYIPLGQFIARVQAARDLPDGPERKRALDEMRRWALGEGIFTERLTVGTTPDNSARVELIDGQRRARARLVVDAAGNGRLDFLGEDGAVVRSITGQQR